MPSGDVSSPQPWLSNASRFRRVDLSAEQLDELWKEVNPTEAQVRVMNNLHDGDKRRWPCPRCSIDAPKRQAKFRRSVRLGGADGALQDADAAEESAKTDWDRAKDTYSLLSFDPIGAFLDWILGRAFKSLAGARVYGCAEHGEFYVLVLDGEPKPLRIYVADGNKLTRLTPRYLFCTGLIETVNADGRRLGVSMCIRVLEGTPSESGSDAAASSFAYTCPMHGTQVTATGDLAQLPHPVVQCISDEGETEVLAAPLMP
jgi:hypothetical protein